MREITTTGLAGTLYYLHQDHLGSTSLTTSITGTLVSRQLFYAYGEVRWSTGTMPTTIGYTGQRRDTGLGSLMFYNARYYSPLLSRFVSADIVIPGAGNPQAFNRYSYVFGNPVRYNDPSGHCPMCIPIAAGVGAAVAVFATFRVAVEAYILATPGADRNIRDQIGGELITNNADVISKSSSQNGVDSSTVSAILRLESGAVERRLFTLVPGHKPGELANLAERIYGSIKPYIQPGIPASYGPGQMQLRTAKNLELLGYVKARGSDEATIAALLDDSASIEYIAGEVHYISDQLAKSKYASNFSGLSYEQQQRLIAIGYNRGWDLLQELLDNYNGDLERLLSQQTYDDQTIGDYNN